MNSFTITVTEAHLKKAIAALVGSNGLQICHRCIVAQALAEVPGLGFEAMRFTDLESKTGAFTCPEAMALTDLAYDSTMRNHPHKISALLPLTLTFTRRN